jgi:hypothetical protein
MPYQHLAAICVDGHSCLHVLEQLHVMHNKHVRRDTTKVGDFTLLQLLGRLEAGLQINRTLLVCPVVQDVWA